MWPPAPGLGVEWATITALSKSGTKCAAPFMSWAEAGLLKILASRRAMERVMLSDIDNAM